MRKFISGLFICALLVGPTVALFALNDDIAEIKYLEKQSNPKKPQEYTVSIIRNAKALPDQDVDFGTMLRNQDQIRVGGTSMVEIKVDPKTGFDAVLTVKPSTVMTLDLTSLKNQNQKAGVNLLSGSVELKVVKLTNGNQLALRTATANMGVRGTHFEVTYSASGDILLSTKEGLVECTTETGKVLKSAPGNVVQGTIEGEWTSIPVAVSSLDDFKRKWSLERIDAFKADPGRATMQFATKYYDLKDRFYKAYAELYANRDVINKWIAEDEQGNIGATAERNREKLKLIGSLVKLRKVNVIFERVYWRLIQLGELYSEGIAATGQVKRGVSVADFFKMFYDDREDLSLKFADIQFITSLYAKRNDGGFPLDDASSALKDEGGFFNKSPDDPFFKK